MVERSVGPHVKNLAELVGGIAVQDQGLVLGERYFPQAVGMIGGGTGLEALNAAHRLPESAIFIIDPLNRFAKNVIGQLAAMPPKKQRRIDWEFFEQDTELQRYYQIVWDVKNNDPHRWRGIERAFQDRKEVARTALDRFFYIDEMTDQIAIPEQPIFDHIDLIYPNPAFFQDPSLFRFISRSLRTEGVWHTVTEWPEWYIKYFGHGGRHVSQHGRVTRQSGVKKPLSVYDLALNPSAYFYVDVKKTEEKLNEPGHFMMALAETVPWSLFHIARGLLSKKKVNIKE